MIDAEYGATGVRYQTGLMRCSGSQEPHASRSWRTSLWSPVQIGFIPTESIPLDRENRSRPQVTNVLPTPVSVPVTK